ncbi:hypothetical protein INT46_001533 [Mucor plumbeus]|uniref:RGS domain-containing protein n=1 Tax=Mucor plumbeus TaxID=97098 RepID=A0A8H7UQZ6_9FUNG|nr:hypothetical protein INT46_001533 [Mucor plumbeus]
MVFSDIAQKALNGFSSSSSSPTTNDITILAPDGLTLEMVLLDQTPSPFSLKDFSEYLKITYCNENLLFYEAVTEYKDRCCAYFGIHLDETTSHSSKPIPVILSDNRIFDFSTYTKHVLTPREQLWFDTLIYKFEVILKDFILSDAPQEINIPYEVRHQLLQSYQTQQLYHPSLLFPACSAVIELLRISAFIPFATDPNRLYCPMKKKNLVKKQKSSPVISTNIDLFTSSSSPPIPVLPPMPLTPPPPTPLPTDITTSTSVGFLKRITATFKIRYSSSSSSSSQNEVDSQTAQSPPLPPPLSLQPSKLQSNWRQVNVSPSAFTTVPSSSPPTPSSIAVTPPFIIKSSTSTSSVNSSSTTNSSVDSLNHHHQHGTFLKHLTSANNSNKKLLPAADTNIASKNGNHKY